MASQRGKDEFAFMKSGTLLTKVSFQGRKRTLNTVKKKKTFRITEDELMLVYKPSKKGNIGSQINLEDIQEIRQGKDTDKFRKASKFSEELCFSVILTGETRILNLVAQSKEDAKEWIHGLRKLKKRADKVDVQQKQTLWIREAFMKADRNQDNTVDIEEAIKLLEILNVKADKKYASRIFNEVNVRNTKGKRAKQVLDEGEFAEFYRRITARPELEEIFKQYAGDDEFLTPEELLNFMNKKQMRRDVDVAWCRDVIHKYEPKKELREKAMMTIDGFSLFMISEDGRIFKPAHAKVYQDMTLPLCHYFINSSHNTYLLKDQLTGPSSKEAYISALRKGCRCVELDIWDGSDGEPVIFHGHTLTSKILFKDAITAIEKYAFISSDYPVILSFENHCSVEQQRMVAKTVREILKDKLYYVSDPERMSKLPSPEELKGKIIIKGKKLPPAATSDEDDGDVSDEDEAAEMEEVDHKKVKQELEKSKEQTQKKMKLAKDLSDIIILSSKHFKGIEEEIASRNACEMSSFVETKALDLAKKEGSELIGFHSKFLSRIYPAGIRTDSSNYNPVPMWNVGAQIVALNFQTDGKLVALNAGRFLQNGNSGYVLKPKFMLPGKAEVNANNFNHSSLVLVLKIISGQQLPKSSRDVSDPYVKVSVYDGSNNVTDQKTEHVEDNGFNPQWNCSMTFEDVRVPELALVRFEVRDFDRGSRDDAIAEYTLPLVCMQKGYHHVPLKSEEGVDISPASLFVHVDMKPTKREGE